jgi:hypothetical protein
MDFSNLSQNLWMCSMLNEGPSACKGPKKQLSQSGTDPGHVTWSLPLKF